MIFGDGGGSVEASLGRPEFRPEIAKTVIDDIDVSLPDGGVLRPTQTSTSTLLVSGRAGH